MVILLGGEDKVNHGQFTLPRGTSDEESPGVSQGQHHLSVSQLS